MKKTENVSHVEPGVPQTRSETHSQQPLPQFDVRHICPLETTFLTTVIACKNVLRSDALLSPPGIDCP